MNDIEDLYFDWLLRCLDPRGVREGVVYVSSLLHNCTFKRRVGRDENRAADGVNLRREFLGEFNDDYFDQNVVNEFLLQECTWFEMLARLSRDLDFLYEGGVLGRFYELTENMGLAPLFSFKAYRSRQLEEFDQGRVNLVTDRIDNSEFDRRGRGGLFPLQAIAVEIDQRGKDIWEQHSYYFIEEIEGVQWTSTN